MEVPREVVIFAIEAKDIATFSEKCSPEVEKDIPRAVEAVLRSGLSLRTGKQNNCEGQW
jgi:Ni,Fe-hydrogenase maturation factor